MLTKLIISCIFLNTTLNIALDMASAQNQSYLSGSLSSENSGRIGLGLGDKIPIGFTNGGTQNYQLKPKYLTQKYMRQPKIITETVVRPIYKKVINRPSILRERYVSYPNMIPSETKTYNKKRNLGVQAQIANLTKQVNVPGNTITLQKVITPTLLVKNERVKVLQSAPEIKKNASIILPLRARSSQEFREINVPGGTIHNRTFIQPQFSKEYINLNIQRAPTRRINHQPVTAPITIQTKIRNKRVIIPGRRIMNQTIIQPRHTLQRVKLNLINSRPIQITKSPIIKPTIKRRNVKKKYHNIVYKVPIQKTITKVEPRFLKVDDVKTIFIPVDENGQELTGADSANVIGSDGFLFGQSGYSNSYQGKNFGNGFEKNDDDNLNFKNWESVGTLPYEEGMSNEGWSEFNGDGFKGFDQGFMDTVLIGDNNA